MIGAQIGSLGGFIGATTAGIGSVAGMALTTKNGLTGMHKTLRDTKAYQAGGAVAGFAVKKAAILAKAGASQANNIINKGS